MAQKVKKKPSLVLTLWIRSMEMGLSFCISPKTHSLSRPPKSTKSKDPHKLLVLDTKTQLVQLAAYKNSRLQRTHG